MSKSMMYKLGLCAFTAGAVVGFLLGAMHTDHTFVQAVKELFVIRDLIEAEL